MFMAFVRSLAALTLLSGCNLALNAIGSPATQDLGSQVKSIEETKTTAKTSGHARLGQVRRADLTSGEEIKAKAFSTTGKEPIILAEGTPATLCFHLHFSDSTLWLTKEKVDAKLKSLREDSRVHVALRDSLAELEGAKSWPAPNVIHPEYKNVRISFEEGDQYVTGNGDVKHHPNIRHVHLDMCIPAPEMTPTAKYLTVMSLGGSDSDKRVTIWEITD